MNYVNFLLNQIWLPIFTRIRLNILTFLFVPVVWKEEVWHCGAFIVCFKGPFTSIWSNLFNDLKIFDKVTLVFHSDKLLVLFRSNIFCIFMCMLSWCIHTWKNTLTWQNVHIFFKLECLIISYYFCQNSLSNMQHTQGILPSSRSFIAHCRSYWAVAPGRTWSTCSTSGEFIWSTSI